MKDILITSNKKYQLKNTFYVMSVFKIFILLLNYFDKSEVLKYN